MLAAPLKLSKFPPARAWARPGTPVASAEGMNASHPALADLERLIDQCGAVRRYLETDHVDVALVTRAERNLYDEALAVLATLAHTAEAAVAFEELVRRADQLKLGGNRELRLKQRCLELIRMLCRRDLDLEVTAWLTLMALSDLGRVVWALRLTDCMLERKGPEWASELVERVRQHALNQHRVASGSAAIDDRTVQLGSKLALERVLFSSACDEELRTTAIGLLDSVRSNMKRIDSGTRARSVSRSRRCARSGATGKELTLAASTWEASRVRH